MDILRVKVNNQWVGIPQTVGVGAYVHIRYASAQPTQDSDMSTTPGPWMGVYSGTSATAPAHYTDYTWSKIAGEGVPAGGNVGDIIRKSGAADYAAGWSGALTTLEGTVSGKADESIITTVNSESTAQSPGYAAGDTFIHNNKLYKADEAIPSGTTITPGTNCHETTVEEEIIARQFVKGIKTTTHTLTPDADGIITIPNASYGVRGLVAGQLDNQRQGVETWISGYALYETKNSDIDNVLIRTRKTDARQSILTRNLDYAVKAAMSDGIGESWTDAERLAALARMGCSVDENGFVKWTAQPAEE